MITITDPDTHGANPSVELRTRLRSTLLEEAELLEALRAVFRQQRGAVLGGNAEDLDDGVFAATRLMRTLHEARETRRQITKGLVGSDLDFEDLDEAIFKDAESWLYDAGSAVRQAAHELLDEVTLLRGTLEILLEDNRRCLDALLGDDPRDGDGGEATGVRADRTPSDRQRAVVDRRA